MAHTKRKKKSDMRKQAREKTEKKEGRKDIDISYDSILVHPQQSTSSTLVLKLDSFGFGVRLLRLVTAKSIVEVLSRGRLRPLGIRRLLTPSITSRALRPGISHG